MVYVVKLRNIWVVHCNGTNAYISLVILRNSSFRFLLLRKMTNKKSCMKNAGFFIFKDKLMMWYNMDVGNFKLKWMEYDEREERDYEKIIF